MSSKPSVIYFHATLSVDLEALKGTRALLSEPWRVRSPFVSVDIMTPGLEGELGDCEHNACLSSLPSSESSLDARYAGGGDMPTTVSSLGTLRCEATVSCFENVLRNDSNLLVRLRIECGSIEYSSDTWSASSNFVFC